MYSLPIDPKDLVVVKTYGKEHKVPLLSIHSAGFYSYFQLHLSGNFPIVDTHPDSTATTDLRLLRPWPELSRFADHLTKDIEHMSAYEHGHIPYVALLLYYLGKWKESHGDIPNTYADKKAFGKFLAAAARTDNAEGGEENFDEAVAAVLKTISAPTLSSAVKEIFDYEPDEVSVLQPLDVYGLYCIDRNQFKFLDHCQCNQAVLHKAQRASFARFSSRYEGTVDSVCSITELVQGESSSRCGRSS
jgi:amyloid beta precursor protein binding protein 1